MRLVYRRSARDQLRRIADDIAADRPDAARRLVRRVDERLALLAETGFVDAGRPGRIPGTREIVHPPYVVVYRHDPARDILLVLSVVHGARRR